MIATRQFFFLLCTLFITCNLYAQEHPPLLIRIAEIQVDSSYLEQYKIILQEEAEVSMKVEPGVICIFPMYDKIAPTQIRILEIYANQEAYENHLKTAHFLKYKNGTKHMVLDLKLPTMQALDYKSMALIFEKYKIK